MFAAAANGDWPLRERMSLWPVLTFTIRSKVFPWHWTDGILSALAGTARTGEDDWPRPDGQVLRYRWEVHPWGDAEVESGGVIALFEDVTAAREMQARLRQAYKMEAVGQLAGGIAHDFNNLLQVIQSCAELTQDEVSNNPKAEKFTGEVMNAARRASDLTRQLLAFSRRQVLTPAILDLNQVIRQSLKLLHRLLKENVEIQADLASQLWPVEVDACQFSEVIINLCVNARDAMPNGGTLTLATQNLAITDEEIRGRTRIAPGDYVMLTVRDTGSGIEPHILEHIFEPFFTTKEPGNGTGMGLPIVFGVVQQSGGSVWAESEPGVGSCFTILVPRHGEIFPAERAANSEAAKRGSETILLAEDDESVRAAVTGILSSLGYNVLSACASDALALASSFAEPIHLLITDVVMPGISGLALSEQLQAVRPALKILFISGYVDDASTRIDLLESKAAFLQKPFSTHELAAKVYGVLTNPKY